MANVCLSPMTTSGRLRTWKKDFMNPSDIFGKLKKIFETCLKTCLLNISELGPCWQ